jgi:hypothetical protein
MKTFDPAGMGWEQCTASGSEIAQLRVWMGLSLREKLEATERLSELSSKFIAQRKKAGLPYIDPYTGEAVRGSGD